MLHRQPPHEKSNRLTYAAGDLGRTKGLLAGCIPKPGAPDFRGFEWRYYWGLCQGDQDDAFPAQSNAVAELAFSPDDRLLASAGYDHRVQVWDFKDRQLVKTYETPGGVEDVGFSPDGLEIMMADTTGCVDVKDVESGRVNFHLQGAFRRAAISPGGTLLALGGGGKQATMVQAPVEVWDYQAKRQLFSFTNAGTYVAFSPDGRRLATGSNNREVKIWNLEDGALWRQLQPVEDNFGMSFSPDGRKLLLGDELGSLYLWDLESGQRLAGVPAHKGNIFKTAISPDGTIIASVGADQTVRLWQAAALSELRILRGHASEVWAVAFSPDSKMLVTGGKDGRILSWSVARPLTKEVLTQDVNFWDWPVFSSDGSRVAVGEKKAGVTVWRVADGRLLDTIGEAERPLAFGTNAASLLALGQNGGLQQWTLSLTNHHLLKQVHLPDMEVRAHAFLPERSLLITGDRQGNIRMWDGNTGAELAHWQAHPDRITSIALSPDHTLLATAAESDDDAKIWDLDRHELVQTLHGHKMAVFGVAFSPDGRTVATASVDDTCCLWAVRTGQRLAELGGHQGGTYSVAFSPDGKTLAVGCNEGELKLWNLATCRDMMTLAAESHTIFATSFSPDGNTLATVSFNHHNEECSLKLWRAPDLPGAEPGSP
ncbi:MAG: WD40 repeat domain-containing protein [Verrucomicrobiia bacterium]